MRGGKHLLLLAALVLVTSQQPQVSMLPDLKQVYSGDLFSLSCSGGTGEVTWFFNDTELPPGNPRFAVATTRHSGSYRCQMGGIKSDAVNITVRECIPKASLILETGHPVMRTNGAVILRIENEDGLKQSEWRCFVYKGGKTKRIMLRLENDTVKLSFQPNGLQDPENIFWCADKARQQRSNQIVVWTSDKPVSLEMYPVPVMVGESVTLRCLVWGTDRISHAVFYLNNSVEQTNKSATLEIKSVKESQKGSYKCNATFMRSGRTAGPEFNLVSDRQELYIYEILIRAELSEDSSSSLSCSCSQCPGTAEYRWYKNGPNGFSLMANGINHKSISLRNSGTYSCRAVWDNGRSLLSKSYSYQHRELTLVSVGIIVLVLLGLTCIAAGLYIRYRRRQATREIYEDVTLNKLDNQYEPLQRPEGARREGEYDTLQAVATGKKEGEHQPSQKDHTLGKEVPEGGAGGYEALRREGTKEEVYHTLGEEGAGGGGGGYEALKKQDKEVEIYHTLELAGTATAKEGH